jgi:hypothetical protein
VARIGRSFPAKAVIGRPRPSTVSGAGAFTMSLALATTGGTIVPPFGPRPRVYCQAVHRASNFHHTPEGCSCQTYRLRPPMPPLMP